MWRTEAGGLLCRETGKSCAGSYGSVVQQQLGENKLLNSKGFDLDFSKGLVDEVIHNKEEWDDEEFYFVVDELIKFIPQVKYEKLSFCAGLLSIKG